MLCSISKINIPIPYSRKKVNIQLDGRSLIITGGNGCGKTSFITAIYNYLKKGIDSPNNNNVEYLSRQINNHTRLMEEAGRDGRAYNSYKNEVEKNKARLEEINNFNIEIESIDNKDIRSLLRFHSATR
ncbi:hypothetical protein [Raoultella ornithinolytica]|jgi:AAA15 family ATPase/GTPase